MEEKTITVSFDETDRILYRTCYLLDRLIDETNDNSDRKTLRRLFDNILPSIMTHEKFFADKKRFEDIANMNNRVPSD